MCISDWRIGRQMRSVITSRALTSGQTLSILPSMQRVGVILSVTGAVIIQSAVPTITIDGQLWGTIPEYAPIVRFHMRDVGDLTTKSFLITNGTISMQIVTTEIFLPESVLSAMLEESMRAYP